MDAEGTPLPRRGTAALEPPQAEVTARRTWTHLGLLPKPARPPGPGDAGFPASSPTEGSGSGRQRDAGDGLATDGACAGPALVGSFHVLQWVPSLVHATSRWLLWAVTMPTAVADRD